MIGESIVTIIVAIGLLGLYSLHLIEKLKENKLKQEHDKLSDEVMQMRHAYNDKINTHLSSANYHLNHANRLLNKKS